MTSVSNHTATPYSGYRVIWGPPGTGKTHHLSQTVTDIARVFCDLDDDANPFGAAAQAPVAICSLTRTAAAEIASRSMPVERSHVGTLHALAYRRLGSPTIAETLHDEWDAFAPEYRMSNGKGDVNDSTADQLRCDAGGKQRGDELYQRLCTLRAMQRRPELWPPDIAHFSARWSDFKRAHDCIDFTDMIDRAIDHVPTAPGNPRVVIADEAQDLSRLEMTLLRKWGDAAGCLIIAGDPWQSLYVWRGSDPTVFDTEHAADRQVLSQSYRVPRLVHAASMRWMKRWLSNWEPLEYHHRLHAAGTILRSRDNWKTAEKLIPHITERTDKGQTVMVAASCGYMLKPLLAALRSAAIPFSNPWRRKRGDWNPLQASRGNSVADRILAFLRPDTGTYSPRHQSPSMRPRLWTWRELKQWTDAIKVEPLLQRGARKKIAGYAAQPVVGDEVCTHDELDTILAPGVASFLEDLGRGGATIDMLRLFGTHLLSSRRKVAEYPISVAMKRGARILFDSPKLHVGTIHSFKGAEADNVFIIPDLSPAAMREWTLGGAARDNVVRMMYVGMTRARDTLVLCEPLSGRAVDLRAVC